MRLLLVTAVDPWTRSVATVHRYAAAGRALGHEVAVFGEPNPELPALPFTTDIGDVDMALFVMQVPSDLPEMPHLARVIDNLPREKRVVVDLWGRYNETIRLEHDFNHLEKLDGHLGWEWDEAFRAISDTILQPTLKPLRADAGSFLFHAYDPGAVLRNWDNARDAAAAWRSGSADERPYGLIYIGSNWQRWTQVRAFLESYAPHREKIGPACLMGWDWSERPLWAIDKGLAGIDTDPAFLADIGATVWNGARFDELLPFLCMARFAPIIHRPLFNHLGLVTNRSFETFYGDTLPVLMLPREFVEAVYGPAALALTPEGDVGSHLSDTLDRPERAWEALLETRAHLAKHHSYARRFEQLAAIAGEQGRAGASR
jgi:hypothetical protein